MSVKDEIVTNFVLALRAKFEAKVNKETDNINGDYSSDNITYPTVKVVKNWVNSEINGYQKNVLFSRRSFKPKINKILS